MYPLQYHKNQSDIDLVISSQLTRKLLVWRRIFTSSAFFLNALSGGRWIWYGYKLTKHFRIYTFNAFCEGVKPSRQEFSKMFGIQQKSIRMSQKGSFCSFVKIYSGIRKSSPSASNIEWTKIFLSSHPFLNFFFSVNDKFCDVTLEHAWFKDELVLWESMPHIESFYILFPWYEHV